MAAAHMLVHVQLTCCFWSRLHAKVRDARHRLLYLVAVHEPMRHIRSDDYLHPDDFWVRAFRSIDLEDILQQAELSSCCKVVSLQSHLQVSALKWFVCGCLSHGSLVRPGQRSEARDSLQLHAMLPTAAAATP
jgi:hypothetical protein